MNWMRRLDQVMTVCKVALANLGMWVRDHYFPASYAHASWQRLQVFFQSTSADLLGTRSSRGRAQAM
jgi:hypothetical protein